MITKNQHKIVVCPHFYSLNIMHMKPHSYTPFISLALLVGCSVGPAQLMQDTPDIVHTSDKTPELVANCIDKKWEEIRVLGGPNIVDVKSNESGIRVTQRFGETVHFVALISKRGTGSRTQLWTQKAIGLSKQRDDVVLCQ